MSEFEKELESILEKNGEYYQGITTGNVLVISKHFKDWQPPEELVVVPQIVADFIKTLKIRGIKPLMDSVTFGEIDFTEEKRDETLHWINEHQEEYMRAWLDGYTVKKEQLYEIRLPIPDSDIENDYALVDISGNIWEDALPTKYKLTKQEIKAIDERYFAFAVKVEE